MSTPFAPVKRRTISSEIRAQLLEAIRTGELQPGSPVPAERQLCEQFGVARTSVREAIQGLTASGYLERRGNRPVVAERLPEIRLTGDSATLDERKALVRQLFEVRRTIEPTMSEFAARRATDAERADIAELAARSTDQLDEFRAADRAFHTSIARACGNPLLHEVYGKTLGALFDSLRTGIAALRRDQPQRSGRHHRLVDDCASGDRRRARGRSAQADRCRGASAPRRCGTPHDRPTAVRGTMDLTNQYCYFYDDEKFNDTDRAGFRRRVINGELLQLCFWRISGGATGSFLHHHTDQEQLGIIVRGTLDFRIGEPDDGTRSQARARRGLPGAASPCGTATACSSATTS